MDELKVGQYRSICMVIYVLTWHASCGRDIFPATINPLTVAFLCYCVHLICLTSVDLNQSGKMLMQMQRKQSEEINFSIHREEKREKRYLWKKK